MWLSIAIDTTLDTLTLKLTVIQMWCLVLIISILWRLEKDYLVSSRLLKYRVQLCLKTNGGAGEMAQSAKCLL